MQAKLHSMAPSHEQIAALAYQFYLEDGARGATSLEDWLLAEYFLATRPLGQGHKSPTDTEGLEHQPEQSSNRTNSAPRRNARASRSCVHVAGSPKESGSDTQAAKSSPATESERHALRMVQAINYAEFAQSPVEFAALTGSQRLERWRGINE